MVGKKNEAEAAGAGLLRAIPAIDECLKAAADDPGLSRFSRQYQKLLINRVQADFRKILRQSGQLDEPFQALRTGVQVSDARNSMLKAIIRAVRAAAEADTPSMRTVVNATGVVLHTNLGRAILAESAVAAVVSAARGAVNLEYDLNSGARGDRDELVEAELCALTGAEAATVVNNNAAAVLLALNSLADHREVIVSRGELIEIGGSFRIPDVMLKSGARLREVGTTNRTHPHDYTDAINPETALLLKVHPSNYRVVGFTAAVGLKELTDLARAHNLEVMEDLGAGALADMSAWGLPREPLVGESVAAGAGMVTFSGDKLLGGPQAGIAVGRRHLIDKMKRNPLKRALRCDKLTLAALEATLRLYLRSPDLAMELPTLRMLRRQPAELELIAARARDILSVQLGAEFAIQIVESTSQIGSGSLPTERLATRALRIIHPTLGPDAIAAMFRRARPPVIGRIDEGTFQLDMRTIEDSVLLAIELDPPIA
ncbi:MAG: L-seryl-tRNA(Sec) selenium transferase [Candidatus Binataceae bacterium]